MQLSHLAGCALFLLLHVAKTALMSPRRLHRIGWLRCLSCTFSLFEHSGCMKRGRSPLSISCIDNHAVRVLVG